MHRGGKLEREILLAKDLEPQYPGIVVVHSQAVTEELLGFINSPTVFLAAAIHN
jgi:hypothetical protein